MMKESHSDSKRNDSSQYEVIVKKRNDVYHLYVPKFCVYVSDSDLAEGYKSIEELVSGLVLDLQTAGFGSYFSTENANPDDLVRAFRGYLVKYSAIGLVLIAFTVIGASFVSNKVAQLSMVDFLKTEVSLLTDIIEQQFISIDPEQEAQRLKTIRSYVEAFHPYLEAFQVNLDSSTCTTPSARN